MTNIIKKGILFVVMIAYGLFSYAKDMKVKQARLIQTINSNWTFNYYPSGKLSEEISNKEFDDSKWSAIAVPHTWQTYETTRELHPYICAASERVAPYWWNGWGWYRKSFTISEKLRDKRIIVEFDGVQKYSKVYINGHLLGEHKGGYTSFYFDLTPYISFEQENVLSVAVSNRRDDKFGTIPPSTAGNFNIYGGIYRDVRLVVTDKIHIPYQGSYKHEGGTFITTPTVTKDRASVNVKTFVKNGTAQTEKITVKTYLTNEKNDIIASANKQETILAQTLACISQDFDKIENPILWEPSNPYLYKVFSEVYAGDKLVDTYESPLGFRFYRWDYNENVLYLNGKKIHIHGTNRHQEYPWLGDAMPKWLSKRDMDDIRYGLNHNFMRTGHYPNDPFIYDYNDKNGIITVEEVPNIKPINYDEEVQEWNEREMIRRDRNHPSILFWSVGNETKDAADSKWVIEEDTTRFIHERKTEGYGNHVNHTAKNLDMENLLRVTIRGWYNKDVKNLEPMNGQNVFKSGQQAGTEEWQHKMARIQDGSIRGRIDGNIVAWLYEDHGCDRIYKNSPLKHVNAKGWVDMYRVPKYMYYLWQANYLDKPMAFIHPHHWREQYLGQKKNIQVDSNCDVVELFVNGKSIGQQYPSKANFHTVEFKDVLIERGDISVIGIKNNIKTEYKLTMASKPHQIVLTADYEDFYADRTGIAIIKADIVDEKGTHVYGATNSLKWEVLGEGQLVGADLYETDIDKNSALYGAGYIDVPVSNVIRTTDKVGTITVKVTSPGLQDATLILRSQKKKDSCWWLTEKQLNGSGRENIKRDTTFKEKVEYLEEIKNIISPEFIQANNKNEYRKKIQQFIVKNNPTLDKKALEFPYLLKRMTEYIVNTKGELTEDDYNFVARRYNDCRMLARVIESRNFHPEYMQSLRNHYANTIITKGEMLDVSKEILLMNKVSRELRIVKVWDKARMGNEISYERTLYYYKTAINKIDDILSNFYSDYKSLDKTDKKRIIKYLYKINPQLDQKEIDSNYVIPYDTFIAIPEYDFLKKTCTNQ